jgi:hypothetical protein
MFSFSPARLTCTRDESDSDDTGLGCAYVCRSWMANSTSVTGRIQTPRPRRYRCCTTTVQSKKGRVPVEQCSSLPQNSGVFHSQCTGEMVVRVHPGT